MSNGKHLGHDALMQLAGNFRKIKNNPTETNSLTISLAQLEGFIKDAKAMYPDDFNGLRLYFVRYPLDKAKPSDQIRIIVNDLSQVSVIAVPVKNYDPANGSGEDYILDNPGDVFALAFADPASNDPGDTTVLCPPKCSN